MQAWFSGSGPSPSSSSSAASSQPPSLLAEWNSYAAARSSEEDVGGGFGIDIEAAVRSANDRVAGTFGILALAYYAISYFPGGSAGMKFLSSTIVSSVLRCFGR